MKNFDNYIAAENDLKLDEVQEEGLDKKKKLDK